MLRKIAKIFVYIALFLFFLECVSRFYLFGFGCFNYVKLNSTHDFGVSGLIMPSSQPELLYELKPNLDTYYKMARFKTNSRGLRDKERSIVKSKDTFRVAVIGPSVVMGIGVSNEDTFCSLLEERLNRESLNISYEVINFGVDGYWLDQLVVVLKHRALEYNPDLILFCAPIMAINQSTADFSSAQKNVKQIYKVKPISYSFFDSFFLKLLLISKARYYKKRAQEEHGNFDKFDKDEQSVWKNAFSEIKEISLKNKIPVIVAHIRVNSRYPKRIKIIKELSLAYGFYFIDTTQVFMDKGNFAKFRNKLDGHANKHGHKIFAEVIYNYLKEQNLLGKP